LDPVAAKLFEYLKCALFSPDEAKLDPADLPEGFRDFAKALVHYVNNVNETSKTSRRALSDLEVLANFDPLTGLYSRHFGMQTFNEWLEQGHGFVVCFIDMDNLKYVNDTFGHSEGDHYILRVARHLKRFSPDALISRLGGDEFMLLAKDFTQAEAEAQLEQLRAQLVKMGDDPRATYYHSMSFGVVGISADNTMLASELLGKADDKMYAYKRAHKAERRL
jgi:diguanylate cyclase (GGDEF)-like protein